MFKSLGRFILTGGEALAEVRYPQVFAQAKLDAQYDVFDQAVVSRETLDIELIGRAAREVLKSDGSDWTSQC